MRKNVHLWLGILVAGVCLYFAFRGISIREMGESLLQAKLAPILIALTLYVVEFLLRSQRWSVLMAPVHPTRPLELYWVMMIGFFANNVLPLRMGELVRAHVCGTKLHISRTASLGTILLERLCDTLSFLTTFLVASLFFPFPPYMKKGAWLLGGMCIAIIVALLLIHHHEDTFRAILEWSPLPVGWKGKIQHLVTHFIRSTSSITSPRFVAEAMAYSLVIWILEGTFLFLVASAFSVDLKYAEAFFLLFALGLSVTLPQAPGYVGTFELFGVTALSLLGIPKNQGLPVILAIHGLQFAFIAALGCVALGKEGVSFSQMTESSSS
jgi:uncharacterized protein (TIRG00374 family)